MKKNIFRSALFLLACISLFWGCRKEKPEPPEEKTGQVMFWTATDLGCGNITVTIDGMSEVITGYYTNSPACGAGNAATFELPEGTYSYSARCSGKTWSGQVSITAGSCFKIQLTSGAGGGTGGGGTGGGGTGGGGTGGGGTGGGSATGQAMFWTATDLGCGNITVNVSGVSRTITSYHSSGAPACGASGTASFDLAPGSYSYSAQCNGKTWSGTVTVNTGACSKIQLTGGTGGGSGGGGGTTTGKATFWIASDLGCGNITVTVSGISRTISSFYNSGTPACGASGTATFDLAPGTYSYAAQCSGKTWSGTVTVTSGGCSRIQLTGGTGGGGGGGGTTTGQGMFWVASDLGCGSITVTCNGVSRTITGFYSGGAPACGASSAATFSFSPGSYSYSARCSNKTWNGTINITANGCSRIQLTR